MFCMLVGIFALRWLSYSVAVRGVVKARTLASDSAITIARFRPSKIL